MVVIIVTTPSSFLVAFPAVIIVTTSSSFLVAFSAVIIVTTSSPFFVAFSVFIIVTTSPSFLVAFSVVIGKQCQFIKFQVNGFELIMQVPPYLDCFRVIRFDSVFDSPFKSFGLLFQESTAPFDSLVLVGLGSSDRLQDQDQGDGNQ